MNHHSALSAFPRLTAAERARFQHLQALHDAIAYRAARIAAPCRRCAAGRCDDHATDAALITAYQHTAATLATQATRADAIQQR